MCASTGVRNSHLGDPLSRLLGIERGRIGVSRVWMRGDDTAVTCRGILAETNIDRKEELGEEPGEEFQGEDDWRIWVVGG